MERAAARQSNHGTARRPVARHLRRAGSAFLKFSPVGLLPPVGQKIRRELEKRVAIGSGTLDLALDAPGVEASRQTGQRHDSQNGLNNLGNRAAWRESRI